MGRHSSYRSSRDNPCHRQIKLQFLNFAFLSDRCYNSVEDRDVSYKNILEGIEAFLLSHRRLSSRNGTHHHRVSCRLFSHGNTHNHSTLVFFWEFLNIGSHQSITCMLFGFPTGLSGSNVQVQLLFDWMTISSSDSVNNCRRRIFRVVIGLFVCLLILPLLGVIQSHTHSESSYTQRQAVYHIRIGCNPGI